MECQKNYALDTALLDGISATLNSGIQALKLYIHYYIDIYLKDVILALSWGEGYLCYLRFLHSSTQTIYLLNIYTSSKDVILALSWGAPKY